MGLFNRLSRRKNRLFTPTYKPRWRYVDGLRLALAGDLVQLLIPAGVQIFEISAEGGVVYFQINSPFASAASIGFVPQNDRVRYGPLSELNQLTVFGAIGAIAHILYFLETN